MNQEEYDQFLARKTVRAQPTGFSPSHDLSNRLFEWQRQIVDWALGQGRAALFEECGLGKSPQQLFWAKEVAEYTRGQVIIFAPLAVAHQTVREGNKFGVPVQYAREQSEATAPIVITNYERIDKFNPRRFAAVVGDESSALKAFAGIRKRKIVEFLRSPEFILLCSATPSPNDLMEIGNHAEALRVMPSNEMLSRFFINDGGKTGKYRLRKHGKQKFYEWIASWAVCGRHPRDFGYDDERFNLPELRLHESVVGVDHTRAFEQGRLFLDVVSSSTGMHREKVATLKERANAALQIISQFQGEPVIVWVERDDEADLMAKLLPEFVEVRGSEKPDIKEAKLRAFSEGDAPGIITKTKIAAFGLNWQHCLKQVFMSGSFSFEAWYQAVKRSHRFGAAGAVDVYRVLAETEGNIRTIWERKLAQHLEMQDEMIAAMQHAGFMARGVLNLTEYNPSEPMRVPSWIRTTRPAPLPQMALEVQRLRAHAQEFPEYPIPQASQIPSAEMILPSWLTGA